MTSVSLAPLPIPEFFIDGLPAVSGLLFVFAAGTTTPLTTYTDASGATDQTNPIVLNSRGEPENSFGASVGVWIPAGVSYKLAFAPPGASTPPTNAIWTIDNLGALNGGGSSGQGITFDTVAQLQAASISSSVKSITLNGYYAAGDGGEGLYAASTAGAAPGKLQSADGAWWILSGEGFDIRQFGAKCDGTTDDTAAILAGNTFTTARGATLNFFGTPLMKSAQTFTTQSRWDFPSSTGTDPAILPPCHIIKDSSVHADLLTFSGQGIALNGIAIKGAPGNTGCNLVLIGNSPVVRNAFSSGAGSHGIRVGSDTAGFNVNSFLLDNPRAISNGGDGIHISDIDDNANAGLLISPSCRLNIGNGLYGNHCGLGTVIIAPTLEANTGYGAYLDAFWGDVVGGPNIMVGGDIEANTAGNLFETTPGTTQFIGVSIQGKGKNTASNGMTYTPVTTGSVSSGTFTDYVATGQAVVSGGSVDFSANISWASNSGGSGQPYISLPGFVYVGTAPQFLPINVESIGISLTSGYHIVGLINSTTSRIQLYQSNGTLITALNFPTGAVSLYVSGNYPLNVPNYYYP